MHLGPFYKLTAVINAGMYADNYKTHVGYLRSKDHVNNSHVNNYQSVMAYNPKKDKKSHRFGFLILNDYNSAIQNLRLIKKPGINLWNQQNREWSEAAIGEDKDGKILFIYSRLPISMHDLNLELFTCYKSNMFIHILNFQKLMLSLMNVASLKLLP